MSDTSSTPAPNVGAHPEQQYGETDEAFAARVGTDQTAAPETPEEPAGEAPAEQPEGALSQADGDEQGPNS